MHYIILIYIKRKFERLRNYKTPFLTVGGFVLFVVDRDVAPCIGVPCAPYEHMVGLEGVAPSLPSKKLVFKTNASTIPPQPLKVLVNLRHHQCTLTSSGLQ